MSWEKVRLADIVSMRTGKLDSNAAVEDGEYPFFTCSQQTLRINEPAFDTKAVLLGGNNAAGIFPLKYYEGKFNAYQRTYVIESLDATTLNIRYLFYALRPALSHFQAASIGAATQYLTKGILDNFRVAVPPYSEQKQIVEVLSAYDDLIENNRRRISLLESSARLLYKEWFVHLRFPGHEHVKIIDGVPEGWERKTLDACVSVLETGDRPKGGVSCFDDGVPSIGAESIIGAGQFDFSKTKYVPESYFAKMRKGIVQDRDVLVYKDGGRPGHFIPHISFFGCGFPFVQMALNSHVYRIRGIPGISQEFLYCHLSSDGILSWMNKAGSGAAIPGLARKDLKRLPVVVPPAPLMRSFSVNVYDLLTQVLTLALTNRRLCEGRDLLLPRLMNGELRI